MISSHHNSDSMQSAILCSSLNEVMTPLTFGRRGGFFGFVGFGIGFHRISPRFSSRARSRVGFTSGGEILAYSRFWTV